MWHGYEESFFFLKEIKCGLLKKDAVNPYSCSLKKDE